MLQLFKRPEARVHRLAPSRLILEALEERRFLSVAAATPVVARPAAGEAEQEISHAEAAPKSAPVAGNSPVSTEDAVVSKTPSASKTASANAAASAGAEVEDPAATAASSRSASSRAAQTPAIASNVQTDTGAAADTSASDGEAAQSVPQNNNPQNTDNASVSPLPDQPQQPAAREGEVPGSASHAAAPASITQADVNSNRAAAELFGGPILAARDVRSLVPIVASAGINALFSTIRTAAESQLSLREFSKVAIQAPIEAAADVAQVASEVPAAVEMAAQVIPKLEHFVIPNLVPLNAVSGFADAISEFAHESALGTTLANATHDHSLAWSVTFAVVAADAILVGRWYAKNRLRQAIASGRRGPL